MKSEATESIQIFFVHFPLKHWQEIPMRQSEAAPSSEDATTAYWKVVYWNNPGVTQQRKLISD